MKQEADEILAEAIKRDLDGAEFHGHDDDGEENEHENAAAEKETSERQRAHANSMARGCALSVRWTGAAAGGLDETGEEAAGFSGAGKSWNAAGWSWRARSSMAETIRGAGRLTASLITAKRRLRTASRNCQPGRLESDSKSRAAESACEAAKTR